MESNMKNKYEKSKKLSETSFKRLIGVKRKTFEAMVEELRVAYEEKHKKG